MACRMRHVLMGTGDTANIAVAHIISCRKFQFPQVTSAAYLRLKSPSFLSAVSSFAKREELFPGVRTKLHLQNRICRLVASSFSSSSSAANSSMDATVQKKLVLLPVANDTEEMEAVILADVLRRAGADVTLASVENDLQILASRKVKLVADTNISLCEGHKYDLIVLPGGMPGAARLRDSATLQKLVEAQAKEKRPFAAVCAAPAVALETWGLLQGLKATCHPSFTERLTNKEAVDNRVVRDGLATTSRGPGTSIEFALSLVEQLFGKDKMEEIAKALIVLPPNVTPAAEEYNPTEWKGKDGFRVLVPIANGSEDIESVVIIDVLRRAGFDVVVASVEKDLQVVASGKVKIVADTLIGDVASSDFDAIVLPGGIPGAETLHRCSTLTKLLQKQLESKRIIAAICASPAVVLEAGGFLKGKKATAYPRFTKDLSDQSAIDARVVIDGLVITSRGPGTTMEFALSIVEKVLGFEKVASMAEAMVLPYSKILVKQAVH
ncbi:hypothetical protein R1sor_016984 [Riccia sorocarpa]|uniref:DJ-1/PfpI domain-containing protein n=1 Tax=Riccia sorocarpa TaxID=122646 RepID=A0ABD3I893_9MARC